MSKLYFVRHQIEGILWQLPFTQPPTKEQQEAIAKLCFQAHGTVSKKTGEPLWFKVIEVEALGPDSVIEVPERKLDVAGSKRTSKGGAGAEAMTVDATGEVRNPE